MGNCHGNGHGKFPVDIEILQADVRSENVSDFWQGRVYFYR